MKRSDTAWAVLIGASSAIAASNPLTQNDLFWHLALGRAVATTGSRAVEEPWALFGAANMRLAPEWLWEVALYGIERSFGLWAIHILVFACAIALGGVLVWLMRDVADAHRASIMPLLPLGALAAATINSRFNERPETLALVLLAIGMVLARKFARASGTQLAQIGALTILLEIVHAQVHGTFVLIPAVVGCASIARLMRRDRDFVRPCLLTFVGLSLGALTSAYGLSVRDYLISHAHGDAVRHIIDMNAPAWSAVNPSERPYFGYYFALLALGIVLSAARRRVSASSVLSALLGCILLATALRAVGFAALLSLPLALEGLAGLLESRPITAARASILAGLTLLLCVGDLVRNDGKGAGGLLRVGVDFDRAPVASARFLRSRPKDTRVLASFASAAPLAYLAQGHAKVLMDSRTPLHFDDTQYALLRDSYRSAQQLEKAAHWFAVEAVVVRHDQPECDVVSQSKLFAPAIVEWGFTTFVRRDPRSDVRPLTTLQPCGTSGRINVDFCGREFDEEFQRDLRRTGWSGPSFLGLLRAERALRCGADPAAMQSLPDWLNASEPANRRDEQNLWLAIGLSRIGKDEVALEMLGELAAKGHVPAANAMSSSLARVSPEDARAHLEPIARLYEDALPISLRLILARACMATQDVACVRFHGLRAFLASRDEALPIVEWIAERDPSAARDDLLQRALRLRTAPVAP
jgi:hypothetical protein